MKRRLPSAQQQPWLPPELWGQIISHCVPLPLAFFRVSHAWTLLTGAWSEPARRQWMTDNMNDVWTARAYSALRCEKAWDLLAQARLKTTTLCGIVWARWPGRVPSVQLYMSAQRLDAALRRSQATHKWADLRMRSVSLLLLNTQPGHHTLLPHVRQYSRLLRRNDGRTVVRARTDPEVLADCDGSDLSGLLSDCLTGAVVTLDTQRVLRDKEEFTLHSFEEAAAEELSAATSTGVLLVHGLDRDPSMLCEALNRAACAWTALHAELTDLMARHPRGMH